MIKKILLGLLLLVAAAQFVRPPRNLAAAPGPNDINVKYPVPAAVKEVLQRACYDCHSNNTRYPWYAEVQPIRWYLDSHIKDGKRHLDFSEYSSYTPKRAAKKAGEISDQVEQRQMPLKSYTLIHAEARLTPAEIKLVTDWADQLHDQLAQP